MSIEVPDPYLPPVAEFVFDAQENVAVQTALLENDPWQHDKIELALHAGVLKSLKDRIREFHMSRHGHLCCYCRTILFGGGHFMIDREHVLPKSKYKKLTYSIYNISVSCKRCNMQYKGNDDKFFNVDVLTEESLVSSNSYYIVHPNLDSWEDHLERLSLQSNGTLIIKYCVKNSSSKGIYTYEYFNLKGLEVNSFNRAQGINVFENEIRQTISDLAELYNQK